MADFMGVHPTFVSQVLAGNKDFSMEQSFAVAEYLELTQSERKFFFLLVQKDRAGSKKLKDYFSAEIEEFKKSLLLVTSHLREHHSLTDEERAVFYSSWLYSAVRLCCSIAPGKSVEEICDYFGIGRKKAMKILDFLLEKNLLAVSKGTYTLGAQHTHLPADSPFIIRHHMNWRTKALQRHENVSNEEIAFTAPMSISKGDFHLIREKILDCIKESVDVAKKSEAEDVAFLNIDWLWLNDSP